MAISTVGVVFKYGSTTPTTELPIKSYPQIMAKRGSLDVTTLKDDAKVYIPSLRETPDSLDFTLNYDPELFADINALTAAQKCELSFPGGSGFTFEGYLSASNSEGSVGAVAEMIVSVMPTTVPVFKSSI